VAGLPFFSARVKMLNAPVEGCSRWDCPFQPHSSLLLSDLVDSRSVLSFYCEKKTKTPALSCWSLRSIPVFTPVWTFLPAKGGVAICLPSVCILPLPSYKVEQIILYSQFLQRTFPLHLKSLFSISVIFSRSSSSNFFKSALENLIVFLVFPSRK